MTTELRGWVQSIEESRLGHDYLTPNDPRAKEDGATPKATQDLSGFNINYVVDKTLYESDFGEDDLDQEPWLLKHGKWDVKNGELRGDTNPSDNHEAALSFMLEVTEKQAVSLDFNLAKGERFSLCFIGGPGPHGQVFVTPDDFFIWMKAGDTGAARVIAYKNTEIATGVWHTLTFIRDGDRLIAAIDDKHLIAGRHELFISPKKRTNLCADTEATRFDNVSVMNLEKVEAPPKVFESRDYTTAEFWEMRETKYGLPRGKKTNLDAKE
jgi:hypothetical protein